MRNIFISIALSFTTLFPVVHELSGQQLQNNGVNIKPVLVMFPSSGLVAYYPFTGNTNDSSGNGYHGTTHGDPQLVTDRFGNAASAYQFDGINQYIELPSAINITSDLSISFWVNTAVVDTNSWPGARFLIDRDFCAGARDWSIGLGKGGKIQFQTGTGGLDDILTGSMEVNDSAWHHVVIIRDSLAENKKIYIDSQLDTVSSFDGIQFENNNIPIFFSATVCLPTSHEFYPGALDDIRIYDIPLTEQEILDLFHQGGWIPVELTSFTAIVTNNNVTLNWATATELNNQGFEILRFTQNDINGWEKIGFVPGSGTTTEPRSYSFINRELKPGKYFYRLKQKDYDGSFEYSEEVIVEINSLAPVEYALEQNYPNPFNPATIIKYNLPIKNLVTIKVFNLLGKELITLVNEVKEAGSYEVEFNSHSGSVRNLPSGIYFYRIEAGEYTATKKMVLLK